MKDPVFCTVILYVTEGETLQEWLSRFVDNTDFFREDICLILADSVNSEGSSQISASFSERYKDNVRYISAADASDATCYNAAAALIPKSEYVNYTDQTVLLRCTDIKKLKESIPQKHIIKAWSFFPVNVQNP